MNLAQFRTAFYANCPQTQTTIVAKALKSSDNWASVMRDNGQKDVIIFHFEGRTFADFLAYFEKSAFYFCDSIEIETRTRAGYLEVFIYALKGLLSLARVKQNDHKRAQEAQEAAELDQAQAEYEAAQAENEAEEVVALPENITFADTDTPEDQEFWKPDYYGRKLYNNGYITYIWGSYRYGANCREGLVYCGDAVIAEDVESAQDAYEIAREHFYSWEYTQMQFAQQSDANAPQIVDVSADITCINLGINAKQALVLGETTAEQMQDNTPQEDAETRKPLVKFAHPESLTTAEIMDFFENFEFLMPTLTKFLYKNNQDYRLAYTEFYEHFYKEAKQEIPKEKECVCGISAFAKEDTTDVDYILKHEIRCACVGIFGEYLDDARIVSWYRESTKQRIIKAYQETSEGLICINNVSYLYPKTDLNLHRAMQAELDRQTRLIKNPNN
jgi:hypothetical protein